MVGQVDAAQQERLGMSGMERLTLRVSEMINHPIAQLQRWVTIPRLESDGEREWKEILSMLVDTDKLEVVHNHDGSVTVRWVAANQDGRDEVAKSEQPFFEEPNQWDLCAEGAPF